MQLNGLIDKMQVSLKAGEATYQLPIGDDLVLMNDLVGRQINLEFNGIIQCKNCHKMTRKSYSQGFCYLCCQSLARCDLCIMRPETCHYHLGTCREPKWGEQNCFKPHIIYLAISSGVKVGITKLANTPDRWIDQGASVALPILQVDNRLKSGQIEVALKQFLSDKTDWRKMLRNDVSSADLSEIKAEVIPKIATIISDTNAEKLNIAPIKINYPVLAYPDKVASLNFDKTPVISSTLNGIKGQYLLLDNGVLNIRKFSSYDITLTY